MDLYNNLNYIKVKYPVVGRIMIPKDVDALISGKILWPCNIKYSQFPEIRMGTSFPGREVIILPSTGKESYPAALNVKPECIRMSNLGLGEVCGGSY